MNFPVSLFIHELVHLGMNKMYRRVFHLKKFVKISKQVLIGKTLSKILFSGH